MKKHLALAGVLLAGGLLGASWLRSPERRAEHAAAAETPVVATAATAREEARRAEAPAPATPAATAPATGARPSPLVALQAALAGGDDHELVVAVEAAVEAQATEALPALTSIDLETAPHSAPAVIQGIASLAKDVGPRERADAAHTLARWFHEERAREGLDAAGNTTALIDALADTGDREAVVALVAALDEHKLPLPNETLIVQRLAELRQPSARPGIARFQARVSALPQSDGLDEELRREAVAAARDALARLGG